MKKSKELAQAEYVNKTAQFDLMLRMETAHLNSEIELLKLEKHNALEKIAALEKFAQELSVMHEEKYHSLTSTIDNMLVTINDLRSDKASLVQDKDNLLKQLKNYAPTPLMQDAAIATDDIQYIEHEVSELAIIGDNIEEA